jgi:glyoxylase-like metal-dependent hydrolase (beta-lactamase superfamily II)
MCPPGGFLMDGRTRSLGSATLACHCLLVETDREGLVLIDTGLGLADVTRPASRLSPWLTALLRPRFSEAETALRQVEKLGFAAADVRHIVLTHLDFDHAGGLDDFPHASVHLLAAERAVAEAQSSWLDRNRFRPAQWHHRDRWVTYAPAGEHWYGFECVRSLRQVPGDILLLPLHGHTLGHAGVAVAHGGGWLLHCGDAYFHPSEMDAVHPRCPPGLRLYQTMMEQDRRLRLHNQERLRELSLRFGHEVRVFCAHDSAELENLRSRGAPRAQAGGFTASRAGV